MNLDAFLIFLNAPQLVRVWLVALARTKLAKRYEPEENS
jgi:hypothetical protein